MYPLQQEEVDEEGKGLKFRRRTRQVTSKEVGQSQEGNEG